MSKYPRSQAPPGNALPARLCIAKVVNSLCQVKQLAERVARSREAEPRDHGVPRRSLGTRTRARVPDAPARTRRVSVLAALALLFLASPALAQKIELEKVAVGFNGKYKVGVWTPVSVTLTGPSVRGRLDLETADGDDVNSIVSRDNIQIDGRPKQLLVRFGSTDGALTVVFRPDGGRPIRWELQSADSPGEREIPTGLQTSQELLVEIGRGVGIKGMKEASRLPPGEEIVAVQLDEASQLEQLPTEWIGYEGVDVLVIGTSQELDLAQAQVLAKLGPDNARWQAIAQWVQGGGRLLVVGGGAADQLRSAFEKMGPLARLLPSLKDNEQLDRLNELEAYSGAKELITLPLVQPDDPSSERRLTVPVLADEQWGRNVVQSSVPLIARRPHGFGEVIFVALDLDRPPLARWPGRAALLTRLLNRKEGVPPAAETGESALQGQLLHVGVSDLAGQLKEALDQFTGIRPVSFVLIAGLALLYIALIGPLDYVLVRKVFRRPELTWVTFPTMVLVFSLATYQLAYWMKGKQLIVNQLDVVDVELATGHVRGQTWFNVFSPDSRTYDVSVTPRLPGEGESGDEDPAVPAAAGGMRTVVSWLGLPGEALGGMERSGSPGLFQGSYRFTAQSDARKDAPQPMTMENVPIQVWSSKSFTARWTKPAGWTGPLVECDLRRSNDRVQGTIRNRMDVPLKECLLVFRTRGGGRKAQVLRIPELRPGQTKTLSSADSADDLAEHLKGIRYVGESSSDALTRRAREYNPLGADVPGIVKLMSFYRLIAGRDHAKLLHRYQGHLDLSHLFHEKLDNRAVLLGFAPKPAAEVRLSDQGRTKTHKTSTGPATASWRRSGSSQLSVVSG